MNRLLVTKMVMVILTCILAGGCQPIADSNLNQTYDGVQTVFAAPPALSLDEQMVSRYQGQRPQQWGETTSGVAFKLKTDDQVMALTFDACGGSSLSNGFDGDLISYLDQNKIPATLFISGQWIKANQEIFLKLTANPNFEIANHGFDHKPCSIQGQSAYGIKGTGSIAEVVQEIEKDQHLIESLYGNRPRFYRSGTNYYDEIAVQIAGHLGTQPVGYSVLGDAGATFSRRQVSQALLNARAGSIVIFHFNHPEGYTAEGIKDAIPLLLTQGYRFVKLSDYELVCYE